MPEANRQLIKRMQEGNPHAFHEFADAWYPQIVEWVKARTTPDKVMDYAQEVWIHLTKNGCHNLLQWHGLYQDTYGNPHSLAAYLKTITIHKVIDLHDKDNKRWLDFGEDANVVDDDGQLGPNPPDRVEGEQIKVQFRHCFSLLPGRDKRMLLLKWNDQADEDLGARYFTTANNVRQRRFQMVKRLRECLSGKLPAYFSGV